MGENQLDLCCSCDLLVFDSNNRILYDPGGRNQPGFSKGEEVGPTNLDTRLVNNPRIGLAVGFLQVLLPISLGGVSVGVISSRGIVCFRINFRCN